MINYIHFGYDDTENAPVLLAGSEDECIENAKDYGGVVYGFDSDTEDLTLVWGGDDD